MYRLAWALVVCFGTLFLFQAFVYRRMPVADGDPYGPGDILELIGTLFCYAVAAVSVLLAVIFASLKKTTPQRAAVVCVVAVALIAISRIIDFRYGAIRW
jgi:hypothetical protein